MPRLLTLMLTTALLLSFSSYGQETAKKTRKSKMQKMHAGGMAMADLPYTASYSSNFTMGNPEHARMILLLYKDFENQEWSKDSWFADTVVFINTDGSIVQGKEQVLDGFKKLRESMTATEFRIAAVIPLKSVDRDEEWVALWGDHDMSSAQNSEKTSVSFQAIWKVDKNNKVAWIRFYQGAAPSQQQ